MRTCLKCGTEIVGMGVYVFSVTRGGGPMEGRGLTRTDHLLCVQHGRNGQNVFTPDEIEKLTTTEG